MYEDFYNLKKIQTFETKNRPNKDPKWTKGLYYRPGSLNKDPTWHSAKLSSTQLGWMFLPSLAQTSC